MDLHYTLWLFTVSFGASALGGMLGMASGIFIVPILTTFGHLGIHVAIGASIVSVIACSCGGAAPFLRGRLTNVRLAVVLETATTLGALSGVLLSGLVPVAALYFIFGVILIVSARQMLARRADPAPAETAAGDDAMHRRSWGAALQLDSSYPDRASGRELAYRVRRIPLGLSLMYCAGLISALLGIGSGVLKIPAMDTALRLPIKVSSATSNFMIGVTAAASAGAYFLRGEIVTAIAGPVALGSVAGAALGARLLMRVSNERLRLLFVAVLALLAVQMLLEAFGVHLFGASP
ncbi:sulfite exporter TauE/SafE family protein [Paraburkholderia sp.]|uniref:sulfite exporter TauE/SafE family protein n=1 Tax=Paraburkholderia sp. TaxID=1926495 RepID=UPI0039E675BE